MKKNNITKNRNEILIMELKMLIRENLNFCSNENTPNICALKQSEDGYKEIEDFCVKAFFETEMNVSEALVMKENLLNPNYIID